MLGNLLRNLLKPGAAKSVDVRALLGEADRLFVAGKHEEAAVLYREALEAAPRQPHALNSLGMIAQRAGDSARALEWFTRAGDADPQAAAYQSNRGEIFRLLGEVGRAIECHRRATALDPGGADFHRNLGRALQDDVRIAEAIAAFETAVALAPQDPDVHVGLAMALLASGDYARGFDEYRWRARTVSLGKPLWNGEPGGGTLLLYAEQGYGDAIQFFRYAPLAASRGLRVVLRCHRELEPLFQDSFDQVEVIPHDAAMPAFDIHASLLDLPRIFTSDEASIPARVPYLRAPSDRVDRWRERLKADEGSLRVGLVWAGSPHHANDRNRSIGVGALGILAGVAGAVFYGLQKDGADPAAPVPAGMRFRHLGGELADFADTAAAIDCLDLVISVDTAVAHLAGALGKPVWTLLPYAAEWRWLAGRSNTPWYPSMRLFRQRRRADWRAALEEVAAALSGGPDAISDRAADGARLYNE